MVEATLAAREPALNIRGTARLWPVGDRSETFEWTCRWQGTPQPVSPDGLFDVSGIPGGERGEVHQHAPQALDLFLKVEGDSAFYGFLNESYAFPDWRHSGYRFPEGQYEGVVTVMYGTRREVLHIAVSNPSALAADFSVELRARYSLDRFDVSGGGENPGDPSLSRSPIPSKASSSRNPEDSEGPTEGTVVSSEDRKGFLVPFIGKWTAFVHARVTPSGRILGRWDDRGGKHVDAFVLAMLLGAFLWFLLIDGGVPSLSARPVRLFGLILIGIRFWDLLIFVLKWVLVDEGRPDPKRSILLFGINLIELRLFLSISAVLLGSVPAVGRWGLFVGLVSPDSLPILLILPFRLLSWSILALAVASVVGSLRQPPKNAI
jgi:hypothetical protein